jgi:hypothetical protein
MRTIIQEQGNTAMTGQKKEIDKYRPWTGNIDIVLPASNLNT